MKSSVAVLAALVCWASTVAVVKGSCGVVSIETWSNSSSLNTQELTLPVPLVVVTHTDTAYCSTDEECIAVCSTIRARHIAEGQSDIGLSFLVGGNGKIYEGAGWRVGGHTLGYNNRSVSLSFIGNFNATLPTQSALDAAASFFGCFLNTRYLGCEYFVVGHGQLRNTNSPGYDLQMEIESWPHWTADVSGL